MVEIYTTGKVEMGHNGGAPGISADMIIFTDLGFTVTAMSNYDFAASAVASYATRLITHERPLPN